MATDYDAPRRRAEDDIETDSLEGLKAAEKAETVVDDTCLLYTSPSPRD